MRYSFACGSLGETCVSLLRFTTEVHRRVATRAGRFVFAIAPAHAFHRRPGLNQRAIDTEVLVREQPCLLRLAHHAPQQLPGHLRLDQPVAVLGEARVIPDRLIDRQSHEPAKQQVVVQLLAQEPLAADRIQYLQRRGSHQTLRRDRRTAFPRVHPLKVPAHAAERFTQQRLDVTQRVIRRHSRLQRHVTEHSALLNIIPAHQISLGCSFLQLCLIRGVFQQPVRGAVRRAWMVCWRLRSDSAPKIPSLSRRNCRRGACRVAPLASASILPQWLRCAGLFARRRRCAPARGKPVPRDLGAFDRRERQPL